MAAVGETSFSTRGKKAERFSFKPFPAGEYDMKLIVSKAEVRKANYPGALPYVNLPIEVLGTAAEEGKKNRLVYHNLFCSLKEGKNGFIMVNKADQLVGLAKALGEEYDGPVMTMKGKDGEQTPCLNPQAVLKWLRSFDGAVIHGRVKIQKGNEEYPDDKNVIDYFEENAEQSEAGESEGEDYTAAEEETALTASEEAEDEEAEEDLEEEGEEEAAELEDEEPVPATRRAIKPGPKVVALGTKRTVPKPAAKMAKRR